MNISLPADLVRAVKVAAIDEDSTVSAVIERALVRELELGKKGPEQ